MKHSTQINIEFVKKALNETDKSLVKDVKKLSDDMYQEFLKSPIGEKAWDDAVKKYPDYNNKQAPNAADFIMSQMQNFIDSKNIDDSIRGEVFNLLHGSVIAGLT